jgi:farnesyl-diphosphate farnesyltransferase
VAFGNLAVQQGNPAERTLLERAEEAIALLDHLDGRDRVLVREVLATITNGQLLDLRRFSGGGAGVIALRTADELHDYTYQVAGCVGEFWTRICLAHLFTTTPKTTACLLADGRKFGQGLQLVNILRDLPRDLRQGRCYLPQNELAEAGLVPADLRVAKNEPRLRPVYDRWLGQASSHLAAGWEYTNTLPWSQARVRLACALPILIGIKTLAKLKNNPILAPDLRIKVSRAELRWIVVRLLTWYAWPTIWQRLPSKPFFQAG